MTELICINSKYTGEQLAVFIKHGISYPSENEIVELDRVENLPRIGKIGLFVKPYTGQYITGIEHGVEVSKELSFDSKRFTTLLGEPISEEILKQFKEDSKKEKELVKIPLKI